MQSARGELESNRVCASSQACRSGEADLCSSVEDCSTGVDKAEVDVSDNMPLSQSALIDGTAALVLPVLSRLSRGRTSITGGRSEEP